MIEWSKIIVQQFRLGKKKRLEDTLDGDIWIGYGEEEQADHVMNHYQSINIKGFELAMLGCLGDLAICYLRMLVCAARLLYKRGIQEENKKARTLVSTVTHRFSILLEYFL
jgi:hypothetical protein